MTKETEKPKDPEEVPTFESFGLPTPMLRALERLGWEKPTPIQAEAMKPLLEGHDMIGRARTGSGKTAAFGLPLLKKVQDGGKAVRALVLAPTRELAIQVADALKSFSQQMPVRILTIYGGSPYPPQLKALRSGVSVVVGTPGRIIDHIERGSLKLDQVEYVVLDEADEMLRMGFIDEVDHILSKTPDTRQVALFSATMPKPIRKVANAHLRNPIEIQVESKELSTGHIEQRWIKVPHKRKMDALSRLLSAENHGATLVFCRTRRGCAEVADTLATSGIPADALHGDLNQAARERVIKRLRAEVLDVVIATDVAARGIDVQHITHVINFDLPPDTETYVHRIGRTARAGRKGIAISLVTPSEWRRKSRMERSLKVKIEQMPIPSNAAIQRIHKEGLKSTLFELLEKEGLEAVRAWLYELTDSDRWTSDDIAVAAIHLLAKQKGIEFKLDDDPREEKGSIDLDDLEESDFDNINEVELFFSVGFKDNVRPADFVGAIAGEMNVSGRRVGRISIAANKSFVGLPRVLAEKMLMEMETIEIRGHTVKLSLSKSKHRASEPRRFDRSRDRTGDRPSWRDKKRDKPFDKKRKDRKGKGFFKTPKRSGPKGGASKGGGPKGGGSGRR
jgi:ATP-dependent RNA helicase DeaD